MDPPIIIGIRHSSDQIKPVKKALTSLIKPGDKIGIEPSPEDILLYIQSQKAKSPLDDLYQKIKKRDNLNDFPNHEINGINQFHEFFSKIHDYLLDLGTIPIGIGSRIRDTSYFDYVRKEFVDKEHLNKEDSLILSLIKQPHFDYHVARKIQEKNLNGIIIGCDHKPISRIINGKYIDLGNRDKGWEQAYQQLNEKLHRIYFNYKDKMPKL